MSLFDSFGGPVPTCAKCGKEITLGQQMVVDEHLYHDGCAPLGVWEVRGSERTRDGGMPEWYLDELEEAEW